MDLFRRTISSSLLRGLTTVHPGINASAIRQWSSKKNVYNLNFDRRIKVDYKDSIKYMESDAFKQTYKGDLIWKVYRRNFKGQFPSKNTRLSCINDEGFVDTSYPCPICRDEYLVIHHENTKLLEQFVDPYTGLTYDRTHHGLCLRQFRALVISIEKARDIGLMTTNVPERFYDYNEYCSHAH